MPVQGNRPRPKRAEKDIHRVNTTTIQHAALAFQQGGSDKVYIVDLIEDGGGFSVVASWGRRGAALQSAKKADQVDREKAQAVFDKLVREKTSKGYHDSVGVAPVIRPAVVMPTAPDQAGPPPLLPQLLNPLPEDQLDGFITRTVHQWCAQQKFDGKRIILMKTNQAIDGVNRTGKLCGISAVVADYAQQLPGDFIRDFF